MNTLTLFILGILAIILPVAQANTTNTDHSLSDYTQAQIEAIQHYGVPKSIDKLKWTYEYDEHTLIISFCYSGEHRGGDYKIGKLKYVGLLSRDAKTHCMSNCNQGRSIILNVHTAQEIEQKLNLKSIADGQHAPPEGRGEAPRP